VSLALDIASAEYATAHERVREYREKLAAAQREARSAEGQAQKWTELLNEAVENERRKWEYLNKAHAQDYPDKS
jgi:hypothetical protein